MNKIEFEISDNTSLVIETQVSEFNINTFNTKVDLLICQSNDKLSIGGYYTLFEALSEIENATQEILSKDRSIDFNGNIKLIERLNKENFEFHLTEDMKHLDEMDKLLKFVLFDGNYFIALYNFENNIMLEIGQKYNNFENDNLKNLKKDFKNWLDQLQIVSYKLSENLIKKWFFEIKRIKSCENLKE